MFVIAVNTSLVATGTWLNIQSADTRETRALLDPQLPSASIW
jgi:hypothetical protein